MKLRRSVFFSVCVAIYHHMLGSDHLIEQMLTISRHQGRYATSEIPELMYISKISSHLARNLKFYPLSIRSAMKDGKPLAFIADSFKMKPCIGDVKLFKEFSTWELLNIRPAEILDIPARLYEQYRISPKFVQSVMETFGIQSTSKDVLEKEFDVGPMSYFVSNSRHYSWPKAGGKSGFTFRKSRH